MKIAVAIILLFNVGLTFAQEPKEVPPDLNPPYEMFMEHGFRSPSYTVVYQNGDSMHLIRLRNVRRFGKRGNRRYTYLRLYYDVDCNLIKKTYQTRYKTRRRRYVGVRFR